MKTKLFMAAILMFILASCTSSATQEDLQKIQDEKHASRITKFNYEGHSYLLYRYGKKSAGIAHDMNCHCHDIKDSDYCR